MPDSRCASSATCSWIPLVRPLLKEEDLADVRKACVEIFHLRRTYHWPPRITVLKDWPELYARELDKVPGFDWTDPHDAARAVEAFIAEIDSAKQPTTQEVEA
jgi:hypothetical protein